MLSDADLLRRLMADSISTFAVLFRHALALHGVETSHRKREVIESASRHFQFDAAPFQKLLDVREERVKPREVEPAALLGSYLVGIGRVIDAVDRLEQ
jgi:hypothetical protein